MIIDKKKKMGQVFLTREKKKVRKLSLDTITIEELEVGLERGKFPPENSSETRISAVVEPQSSTGG